MRNNLPIHSLGYISLKTKMMKGSLGFDGQTRTFSFCTLQHENSNPQIPKGQKRERVYIN